MNATETPDTPAPARNRRQTVARLLVAVGCLLVLAVVARAVLIRRMMLPRLVLNHDGIVIGVGVTPDGSKVVAGEDILDALPHPRLRTPADVYLWNAHTGRLIRRLHGLFVRSNLPVLSPDGSRVIASGEILPFTDAHFGESVVAWNVETGQQAWTRDGEMPLAFSPDGSKFACAIRPGKRAFYNSGFICDATTGKTLCRTSGNVEDDSQTEFTPDGRLVGVIDGTTVDKAGHHSQSDDENIVYAGTYLRLWRADNGQHTRDYPFIRARAFDFAQDGKWLVLTSEGGHIINGLEVSVVRRIDMATGKVLWTRTRSMNEPDHDADAIVNTVAISPNGKYVVLQSDDNRLIVLDARTGRELFRPFNIPSRDNPNWAMPGGLAFSADGKTLVSRNGHNVLVWDARALQ